MKYCVSCGASLNDAADSCPACGAVQPAFPIQTPAGKQAGASSETESIEHAAPQPTASSATPGTAPEANPPREPPTSPAAPYYWQQPYGSPYPAGYPNPYGDTAVPRTPSAVGYLVWSILLTIFSQPLFGVLGIVFAALAMSENASYESVKSNIRLSKIFCIIGTVLDALILIGLVLLIVMLAALASSAHVQP